TPTAHDTSRHSVRARPMTSRRVLPDGHAFAVVSRVRRDNHRHDSHLGVSSRLPRRDPMSHPERRRSMFLAMLAALALGAPAFAAPSPATISISFGATTVPLNAAHDAFFLGVTSLTFTIANPNASTMLTGVSVTDPLP